MSGKVFNQHQPRTIISFLLIALLGLAGSAGAAQNLTVSWNHEPSGVPVSAYQLYQNNTLLCETSDPNARQITCPAEIEGKSVFSVAAVYGNTGEPVPPANTPPSTQNLSLTMDEDGAIDSLLGASDLENDTLSYAIVSGPTSGVLILTDPMTGIFSYKPNKDFSGVDAFTYKANDGKADSATASVSITINPVNDSPAANAGADQSVSEGQSFTLDAAGSSDIDDGIASYSWTQISGPSAVLSSSSDAKPTAMTPDVGVNGAVITYELTVTDAGGLQSKDTVSINVLWVNISPVSNAGADQSVSAGATVNLDGSGSSDADDGIASFKWTQTAGTTVNLSDSSSMKPSFTAPAATAELQSLNFALTVTDRAGMQHTDSIIVEVLPKVTVPTEPTKNMTFYWTAPTTAESVTSYKISHNGNVICETVDGSALQITCPVTLDAVKNEFSVTAVYGSSDETGSTTSTVSTNPTTEADPTTPTSDTVTTGPANDPVTIVNKVPFASAVEITVAEDGTVHDTLTGIDADGDTLTYTILTAPTSGLVELLNMNTGEFRYMPDRDITGQDSFTYEVSDGKDVSNKALVTITITPANDAPIANAGPDQVVYEGETVMLDSTNSYDVDDEFLTVSWTQLDGPTVVLSDPSSVQPQFEAVDIGMESVTLTFQLTVTDPQGLEATDTSSVNIVWVNEPPMAMAGEDQAVSEGDTVALDASGSTDSDDGIASYSWVQISGPEVALSDPRAMQPTFAAPNVGVDGASITFEMTATDFGGLYTKDTVVINITWVNTPPTANAGTDQTSSAGATVTLDGSLSKDEDDGIALIYWSQKSGTPVTLDYPTALQPTFKAPAGILTAETLIFELSITDYSGLQHTDSVNVSVLPLPQTSVPGDVDGDGDLDSQDLALLTTGLNTCTGQTGYIPSADLNADTCVTKVDSNIWKRYFRSL